MVQVKSGQFFAANVTDIKGHQILRESSGLEVVFLISTGFLLKGKNVSWALK
jgi:hypothetical protein